jgi:GDP-L-fucose synthase
VLPALIRRFHEAAARPEGGAGTSVTCWGTGTPLREFLHVDDLGEACVFALERWDPDAAGAPQAEGGAGEPLSFLNVGTGVDLSIRELAGAVAAATGFAGTIAWDTGKPDGTPKKQLDVSRLAALGWRARIPLAEGLAATVADFRARLAAGELRAV